MAHIIVNTTTLRAHLKCKHPSRHDRLLAVDKTDQGVSSADELVPVVSQQWFITAIKRGNLWLLDSREAMKLLQKLVKLIIFYYQPFSIIK